MLLIEVDDARPVPVELEDTMLRSEHERIGLGKAIDVATILRQRLRVEVYGHVTGCDNQLAPIPGIVEIEGELEIQDDGREER